MADRDRDDLREFGDAVRALGVALRESLLERTMGVPGYVWVCGIVATMAGGLHIVGVVDLFAPPS